MLVFMTVKAKAKLRNLTIKSSSRYQRVPHYFVTHYLLHQPPPNLSTLSKVCKVWHHLEGTSCLQSWGKYNLCSISMQGFQDSLERQLHLDVANLNEQWHTWDTLKYGLVWIIESFHLILIKIWFLENCSFQCNWTIICDWTEHILLWDETVKRII